MAMKGMFLAMVAILALSGCATMEGNGAGAQARRTAYVQAHPNNPFDADIVAGRIAVGMTQDDLFASQGMATCGVENTTSDGFTMRCQTMAQGMADDVGTLVVFDGSGHIAQYVH